MSLVSGCHQELEMWLPFKLQHLWGYLAWSIKQRDKDSFVVAFLTEAQYFVKKLQNTLKLSVLVRRLKLKVPDKNFLGSIATF